LHLYLTAISSPGRLFLASIKYRLPVSGRPITEILPISGRKPIIGLLAGFAGRTVFQDAGGRVRIARAFANALKERFGRRVQRVILFGSLAPGGSDGDIDILVVNTKRKPRPSQEGRN